ncbi:MAG: glycosyltransferase [Labilithrix sp.]|nr:glycosyltransferase [Labilithrix sp.]
MEHFVWYLETNSAFQHLSGARWVLFVTFALYQVHYVFLLFRWLVIYGRGREASRTTLPEYPAALVVMPTLLRSKGDLEGLKAAITSVVDNGYPGELYLIAAIDDGRTKPELFAALERFVAGTSRERVHVFATCTERRTGKAVAIEHGVRFLRAKVEAGVVPSFPKVFFNMDADSALGEDALRAMVARLFKRGRISGARPMIVTSNVCIAKEDYWKGWRSFFTVRGQIAIQVAREYTQSIAVGKFNWKLTPVVGASGALYCTWSELVLEGPRWAAFMQTLGLRHWLAWWLGAAPPSFAASDVKELPEAMTGPGDDTWMTWLACCARWSSGRLTLELPRTPAHAALYMLRAYFVRPVSYESSARICTKTPTTIKALFKQRIRWNSSRIHNTLRWSPVFGFNWAAGMPAFSNTVRLVMGTALMTASLLLLPLSLLKGSVVIGLIVAHALALVVHTYTTLFTVMVDGGLRRDGAKLLAVPLSVVYHFVFTVLPSIIGIAQDIVFFGVNTNFAPEETFIKSRLSRIAIAYRLRRAFALTVRSVLHNDVPLGWFWLGWHETKWTPSGFEGWTTGKRRVLKPREVPSAAPAAAPAVVAEVLATTAQVTPSLAPAARISLAPAALVSLAPAARVSLAPAARVSLAPPALVSLAPAARLSLVPGRRVAGLAKLTRIEPARTPRHSRPPPASPPPLRNAA